MHVGERQVRDKVISLKVSARDYRLLRYFSNRKGLTVSTVCYLIIKEFLLDELKLAKAEGSEYRSSELVDLFSDPSLADFIEN